MRIENSIGGRVDLAPIGITGRAEIAALIMGLPFQGHLVFGITFAGFNHGRALVAMSLQEARALADAVTKVVAATEVGSKGADAVMRLERGRSTVEFAALLPTEKEPQPGWELSILTQATIGHASATVTVDAQQVRGILAELTKIADAVEAFVTFEEGLADEGGPATSAA